MESSASPPMTPLVLLITAPAAAAQAAPGTILKQLARTPVPSPTALAATIATGAWVERHGVITKAQPHADRLGYEPATPHPAAGDAIWTRAAQSGLDVGVCNWPHPIDAGTEDGPGRVDRIETEAIEGLACTDAALIPPGTMVPPDLADGLRDHSDRHDRRAMTFAGLEALADRRPDLLIGWLPRDPEDDGDDAGDADRFESLRRRLSAAHSGSATLLVLRHPTVGFSIFDQPRVPAPPRLEITGEWAPRIRGRPRVDAIAGLIEDALGIESNPATVKAATAAGGTARLDAAGLPKARRLSPSDLRQYDHDTARVIGATLVARGLHQQAEAFLINAVQTQHGRIDVPVLALLLHDHRRRRGETAASRLLDSVRDRLPEALGAGFDRFLAGDGPGFVSAMEAKVSAAIGRFAIETLLLDLRRRRCLDLKPGSPSRRPDARGGDRT